MKLEQSGAGWILSHETKTLKLTDHEAMRLRTSNAAQRKGYLWKTVMPRLEGTRPDRKQLSADELQLRAWLDSKESDWAGMYPLPVGQKVTSFVPAAPAAPVAAPASTGPLLG